MPLPGVHGGYCERCYRLAEAGLKAAPALVYHLLAEVAVSQRRPTNDGSQRTRAVTAALPINTTALDEANEVFSIVAGWSRLVFGDDEVTGPAWRDGLGKIVGVPYGADPLAVRADLVAMTGRLRMAMEEWMSVAPYADVLRFRIAMDRIRGIDLRHPTSDRPRFSTSAACLLDGARLLIVPPREPGGDRAIICSSCGRHYTEDEHERAGRLLVAVAKADAKRPKHADTPENHDGRTLEPATS